MNINRIRSIGIVLTFSFVVSACAGIAAITGKGGTVAEIDSLSPTIKQVSKAKFSYPGTAWESIVPHEGADFIYFTDNNRVLVGTVESGAYLGVPDHKQIIMYDADTGSKLWEADRNSFTSGGFSVFRASPNLLILGKDNENAQLMALDPATGIKQWELKIKSPDQIIANDDATRLYLLTNQDAGTLVKAIDSDTGTTLWNTPLPNHQNNRNSASQLLLGAIGIYVVSENITRIDPETGNIQWNADHPLLTNQDSGAMLSEQNIILWGENNISLIDANNGKQLWHKDFRTGTRLITHEGDSIYRVTNKNSSTQDIVQAIKIKNGKLVWSSQADSALSSPLIFKDKKLLFSTEKSAYVLSLKNGQPLLKDRFTEDFATQSPSQAQHRGQVDIIHIRSNQFYISREKAGVIAYSLERPRKLWQQMHHKHMSDEYSADARSTVMIVNLVLQRQMTVPPEMLGADSIDSTAFNAPLQSSQRSIEFMKQRADRVLDNSHASSLERQSALESKITSSNLAIADTQTQIASERIASASQLASSIGGLQQSIQTALKQTAIKGMVSRIQLTQYSADHMRARRFQGKYYVRALYDKGRGVTLIDLDRGKRADFLFSPHIDALFGNGLDLQSFAIDPDNQRIITVAVGLDDTKYQEYVKWKHRLPMTSVLSFDIDKLKFSKESKFIPMPSSWQEPNRIHQYAGFGQLPELKKAVESGAEINIVIGNTTPLIEGAMNAHPHIVEYLLANGADVNLRDAKGISAVDITYSGELKKLLAKTQKHHQKNYIKIRQLLFDAGAEDSPAKIKALDLEKILSEQEERPISKRQQQFVKAAGTGNLAEVKSMLESNDNGINSEMKELALVSSAMTGQVEMVQYFLKIGVSPNAKNKHGESAYQAAEIMHNSMNGNTLMKDMWNKIGKTMLILEKAGGI